MIDRATNERALKRLAAWARRHGGRLVRAPRERSLARVDWRYQESPFVLKTIPGDEVLEECQLGIIWEEKRVFCSPDVLYPEVIHELGHVFAATVRPSLAGDFGVPDEGLFFGWEYLMAKRLGPIDFWEWCNEGYSIPGGHDFGAVSPKRRQSFIQESLERSIKAGCIVRGKPVSVR